MQDLEVEILNKLKFKLPVYYRYVVDTFLIIPCDKIHETIEEFNSYHFRLQFTHELEKKNNAIHFFNVEFIRNDNGNLKTNWCRKSTYSGRLLNFYSNHPIQHTIGIINKKW